MEAVLRHQRLGTSPTASPPNPVKTIKAERLWDLATRSAWACADPGLQFHHDTINECTTCPADGPIRASNPCSEYMFRRYRLQPRVPQLELRFRDASSGRFDMDATARHTDLDDGPGDLGRHGPFPSREIARKSYDFRTLVLGYANLGTLLMVMGLPYDSPAPVPSRLPSPPSWRRSLCPVRPLGRRPRPFPPRYAANAESMLRVIRNHRAPPTGPPPRNTRG
jgi:ribonucleoside-diphosphate reductase alpha chain